VVSQALCPLTTAKPRRRCLLIVDGHGSHVTAKFATYCFKREIDLLIMPAHCSHKLQPLDVALFKPLKKAMSDLARQAQAFAGKGGLRSTKHNWKKDLTHARYKHSQRQMWKQVGETVGCTH
jgi:hypothetical protein